MKSQSEAPFWDHIEELRTTLIRIILIIFIGSALCFIFIHPLFAFLEKALPDRPALTSYQLSQERIKNLSSANAFYILSHGESFKDASLNVHEISLGKYKIPPGGYLDIEKIKESNRLILLSPTEGFAASLKLAIFGGIFLTAPFWLLTLLSFISPGLNQSEQSVVLPMLCSSLILAGLGILTSLYITLPISNSYLYSYNARFGENFWGLALYIDHLLIMVLAHGIAFASFGLLFALLHFNQIQAETLASKRRYAIIIILIISAILTPPDVLSQILLAMPLMLLYEAAILYGKLKNSKTAILPEHG